MKIAAERLRALRILGIGAACCALASVAGYAVGQTTPNAPYVGGPVNTGYKRLAAEGNTLWFVYSNAAPGKEKEYNEFYARHVGDIMKLPDFVSAQRFVLHPRPGRPDPQFRYLAIYEMKGDPEKTSAELGPAVKEGRLLGPPKELVPELNSNMYVATGPMGPH